MLTNVRDIFRTLDTHAPIGRKWAMTSAAALYSYSTIGNWLVVMWESYIPYDDHAVFSWAGNVIKNGPAFY